MHCLAPYFIRCYDPSSEEEEPENRYNMLNRIGQYDLFKLLSDFMEGNKIYKKVEMRNETYRFSSLNVDKTSRTITGWMSVGVYGVKNDIINTEDNELAFSKEEKHADVKKYYFSFYIPLESRKGICLLYTYKSDGVKSLFQKEFNEYFNHATKKNIQINPLSYDKAMQPWLDAETKEIKVVGFKPVSDIADKVASLGDIDFEYSIKAKKNKSLGKLSGFLKKDSDEYKLIELLNAEGDQVKALVAMNGSKKTFRIGHSNRNVVCQIEIDEELVSIVGSTPDFDSLNKWASGIIIDIRKTINI